LPYTKGGSVKLKCARPVALKLKFSISSCPKLTQFFLYPPPADQLSIFSVTSRRNHGNTLHRNTLIPLDNRLPYLNMLINVHFSFHGDTADSAKVGAGINHTQKKGEKS
jgi:hypothetical protein